MTLKQIEEKVIELKHRRPFVPFVFELTNGQAVEVPDSCVAVNETGADFFGSDGAIVDIDFKNVPAIRINSEAVP